MGDFVFTWKIEDREFSEVFKPYSFSILREMHDWESINNQISKRDISSDASKQKEHICLNNPDEFE